MCGKLACNRIGVIERSQHEEYVKKQLMNGNKMNYHPLKHSNECYWKLLDHHIDVAIADSSSAEYFTQTKEYCQLEVTGLPFGKTDFGIALPKLWPYKQDLDSHIMKLKENGEIDRLLADYFQEKLCDKKNSGISIDGGLRLKHMYGLFIAHFSLATVILVVSVLKWHFVDRKQIKTRQPSVTTERANSDNANASYLPRWKRRWQRQKAQRHKGKRQKMAPPETATL